VALERGETHAQLIDSLGEIGGAVGAAGDVALDSRECSLNRVEPVAQLLPQACQHHHDR